jgi:hypothetical protein
MRGTFQATRVVPPEFASGGHGRGRRHATRMRRGRAGVDGEQAMRLPLMRTMHTAPPPTLTVRPRLLLPGVEFMSAALERRRDGLTFPRRVVDGGSTSTVRAGAAVCRLFSSSHLF